jgi:hypothetical protein
MFVLLDLMLPRDVQLFLTAPAQGCFRNLQSAVLPLLVQGLAVIPWHRVCGGYPREAAVVLLHTSTRRFMALM